MKDKYFKPIAIVEAIIIIMFGFIVMESGDAEASYAQGFLDGVAYVQDNLEDTMDENKGNYSISDKDYEIAIEMIDSSLDNIAASAEEKYGDQASQ